MTNQVATYLKYANLQMAAEALFGQQDKDPGTTTSGPIDPDDLTTGNNRSSKFTVTQAKEFVKDWEVVEHISNTTTGFSGTMFRCKTDDAARGLKAGELVMSMRSTEFIDDAVRDSKTNELEVKGFGWAFGQIADMMAWYDKLDATVTGGKSITVTGYSLSGHLATAFNQVMVERKQGWRIDNTYTFNGAGIGEVKDGHSLVDVLNEFNAAKSNGANAGYFTDSVAKQLYLDALVLLDANGPTAAQIAQVRSWIVAAKATIAATPSNPAAPARITQLDELQAAIGRVEDVNKEAERVAAGISSGGSGGPALPTPKQNIAQIQLDYQLAVGRAAQYTSGYYSATVPGAIKGINPDRALRSMPGASPVHDIFGAPLPSAVANSQMHIGQSTPIYIEDQPLTRGSYVGDLWDNSNLLAGETRLLNNGFEKNVLNQRLAA